MALTFEQMDYVYPRYGASAWLDVARVFREARRGRVDVMLFGDSQSNQHGDFATSGAALPWFLNRAIGCKIPGTGILPMQTILMTGSSGIGFTQARVLANVGTRDLTKYPPPYGSLALDISSADQAEAILLQPNAWYTQHAFTDIGQGAASVLDKGDDWWPELVLCGANNAVIHGGTAGSEVVARGVRGSNPSGYFSGTTTTEYTSAGLNLAAVGNDVPVRWSPGPVVWSTSEYLSFYPQCSGAGKVRVAGIGWDRPSAPGFRVHNLSEGSYKTNLSPSILTSHANCGPFLRAMTPTGRPRMIIVEYGENDFGTLVSAATWKTYVKLFLNWLRVQFGAGSYVVLWVGESPRGDDVTNGNWATVSANRAQQPGVLAEVRDEGYPELFVINYTRYAVEQGMSHRESTLSGLTYLGDARTLPITAGSVAITQNVSYVSEYWGGRRRWWLYTGATTTIGAGGVINSIRYMPGGDLAIPAPVSNNPSRVWRALCEGYSRPAASDGAPTDWVHPGSDGQTARWRAVVSLVLGAIGTREPGRRMVRLPR